MAYSQKNDLLKHMQRLHVGDALYNCTVVENCTAAFRLKSELVDHYKIHYQPSESGTSLNFKSEGD